MIIKIPDEPRPDKVLEFRPSLKNPTLSVKHGPGLPCRHEQVTAIEEDRSVHCSKCDAVLDPFDVILSFARKERNWFIDLEQWEAKRDSMLSERYDEEWLKRAGDVVFPPDDLPTRVIWDTFRRYFKDKFCGMYRRKASKRRGPTWYGRSTDGAYVSYEYARSRTMVTTRGGGDA